MEIGNLLEDYFQTSLADKNLPNVTGIIAAIVENRTSLETLFQLIEVYITSKENQKRSRSVKFISELVLNLPDGHLSLLEIKHLATFLCSKLEDHYTVSTAALPGLSSLLQSKLDSLAITSDDERVNANEIKLNVIKSVLRDIHVQSMIQADRNIVFNMCKFMLGSDERIQLIKSENYETDFVYGFIQAMDGEKDPRNLLVCFECLKLICQHLKLGPFVDETFEVFSCYFPIDFTPPKSENFVITKQMLIVALRECFASKREFAKLAIPLIIEKLSSSVEEAQLDSLETFAKCARTVYDPNDFKEHIEQLWSLFQQVAMNATKASLEYAALDAIRAMANSLSRSVQSFDSTVKTATIKVSIDSFVEKALDSCASYLNEPDLKLVWPNVKCLQAVASGSSTSNLLILKNILPLLLKHYNSTSIQNQKKTYLDILWQFVSNSRRLDKSTPKVLKENINELLKICFVNESNKMLRMQSLEGFINLLSFDKIIEQADKIVAEDGTIAESNYDAIAKCVWHTFWVTSAIEANAESENEKSKIIDIFFLLLNQNQNCQEWFFRALDETLCSQKTNENASRGLVNTFEIVEKLAMLKLNNERNKAKKETTDEDKLVVIEKLNSNVSLQMLKLFQKFYDVYLREHELNEDCLFHWSSSLSKSIECFNELKKLDPHHLNEEAIKILDDLVDNLLQTIIFDSKLNYLFKNGQAIAKVSQIFKIYSLNLKPSERTQKYLDNLSRIYFESLEKFDPFNINSHLTHKYKLSILMQSICSLDKTLFKQYIEDFFVRVDEKLVPLSIGINESQDEMDQRDINLIACQFYSSLLNKLDKNDLLSKKCQELSGRLVHQIEEARNGDEEMIDSSLDMGDRVRRLRHLNLWIWITKALVLREHSLFTFYSDKLIEWLDDSVLCETSSKAFDIILNEKFDIMDVKTAANIKLFYKQRFFNSVYEKLQKKFESKDERSSTQKPFYMKSVLNMVMHLPKNLIHKQIQSMLPILLYALSNTNNGGDEQLLFSSLRSLELFIQESAQSESEYFIAHISDIVGKLIAMCQYEANLDIRLLSLKCMNNLATNVSPNRLIQYQKLVCKQLEPCLSDKKRICRQMAVTARNKWFLLTTKNL